MNVNLLFLHAQVFTPTPTLAIMNISWFTFTCQCVYLYSLSVNNDAINSFLLETLIFCERMNEWIMNIIHNR